MKYYEIDMTDPRNVVVKKDDGAILLGRMMVDKNGMVRFITHEHILKSRAVDVAKTTYEILFDPFVPNRLPK